MRGLKKRSEIKIIKKIIQLIYHCFLAQYERRFYISHACINTNMSEMNRKRDAGRSISSEGFLRKDQQQRSFFIYSKKRTTGLQKVCK